MGDEFREAGCPDSLCSGEAELFLWSSESTGWRSLSWVLQTLPKLRGAVSPGVLGSLARGVSMDGADSCVASHDDFVSGDRNPGGWAAAVCAPARTLSGQRRLGNRSSCGLLDTSVVWCVSCAERCSGFPGIRLDTLIPSDVISLVSYVEHSPFGFLDVTTMPFRTRVL